MHKPITDALMGIPTKVADGIFQIQLPLPCALDHVNVYLLEDGEGWILVDTGIHSDKSRAVLHNVLNKLTKSRPLKAVLATHSHVDHIGAAGWICENWNATLWVTKAEYDGLKQFLALDPAQSPDHAEMLAQFYHRGGVAQSDYEKIISGLLGFQKSFHPLPQSYSELRPGDLAINGEHWKIFVNDGHTVAHTSLFNQDQKLLISGDQVLEKISSNVSVRFDQPSANPLLSWLDGLKELKHLPSETLVLPSHRQVMRNLHERVDELVSGYEENAQKTLRFCRTPSTAEDVLRGLFPRELHPFEHHLAFGETLAYLNFQLDKGSLITLGEESGIPLYRAV